MTDISKQDRDSSDEEYKSSEDEDFDPKTAPRNDDNDVSSSEDDAGPSDGPEAITKKRKEKKKLVNFDEELGSGDEETIKESKRAKRRRRANGEDDEDEGGAGGEIKTRAQRRAEKIDRAEHRRAQSQEITINVDELWARLSSAPVGRRALTVTEPLGAVRDDTKDAELAPRATSVEDFAEDDLVTITRRREFAGETVTSEESVHKDSKEAKEYFAAQQIKASGTSMPRVSHDGLPLRRPLARASLYEPNPTGEVKGLPADRQRLKAPSRADVLMQEKRLAAEKAEAELDAKIKAQRLNTVQKSALDWTKHVDTEGLKDELSEYDRSKQGFMGKMDFLQSVSSRREDEAKKARLQTAS